jgi:hypothetical protein
VCSKTSLISILTGLYEPVRLILITFFRFFAKLKYSEVEQFVNFFFIGSRFRPTGRHLLEVTVLQPIGKK